MKFLVVGDVVGRSGIAALQRHLADIVKNENINCIIINGENATSGRGIKERELYELYDLGADVVTMGNHIYYRKEAKTLYINEPNLVIPANVTNMEGHGSAIIEKNGIKIGVINLLGKVHLNEINSEYVEDPFSIAKKEVEKLKDKGTQYIFVDFHAEATAEKIAMSYYLEKEVTCVYGTHTHVQTSDERVYSSGMAYITDVGMTGPRESVLGLKKEIAIDRFVTGDKMKYECSDNPGFINSIIVETDDETKKAISIKRYNVY